jgi:hypothetical protein
MAKSKSSEDVTPAKRTKTTVYLSDPAFQRLGVASVAQRKQRGDNMDALINLHLATYVLVVRKEGPGQSDVSADSDIQLNLPDSPAA